MRAPDWTRRTFMAAAAAAVMAPRRLLAGTRNTFTLSGGTILLHTGERVQGGIRVEQGQIVEVGSGVTGGIDLAGQWVVPGFTDAGCRLGLLEIGMERETHDDSAGESEAADAQAWDGYNPRSELIPVARVNGITSAVVHPTLSGLIPGQAGLMRTAGDRLSDVIIEAPVGLCINLGRAGQGHDGPSSRIALMKTLRNLLDEIDVSKSDKKHKNKKKDKGGDENKSKDEILRSLKQGDLLALVRAERADDIERALEIISAYELRAALVGCTEGHLVADLIAEANLPVLLGPLDKQPSNFEHPHARYDNAAVLHAAGVKLAFRTGSAHGVRNLPTLAGLAVAHGLPFEAAIAALTHAPMDILGVEGLGRMEAGSEATFFTVEGDPLQPRHRVHQVWIAGEPVSMETRQTRLYDAFRELK